MEQARATWTDERLDDLSHRVGELSSRTDAGFDRVDQSLRELRGDIGALQRLMIQLSAGTVLAVLATLVSVVATRA